MSRAADEAMWRKDIDYAKVVALAISLVIQFVLLAALISVIGPPPEEAAQEQSTLKVIFINRSPIAGKVVATMPEQPVRPHNAKQVPSPKLHVNAKPIKAMAAPTEHRLSAPATRLNLAIAPEEIDFQRNPVKRPGSRVEATPTRLQVRMLDTSLAGRLQAATQRRICGELRSALANNRESTTAIMSDMQRYGCRI